MLAAVDFLSNALAHIHRLDGFEFSNLTLLVGVLVSTAILRTSGNNPGGILAAAFLILAAVNSIWWALVLPLAAIIIAFLYKRFFSHIYYGRQPLFIMAAMSVSIMTVVGLVMDHYGLVTAIEYTLPLGLILPAILASTITKQGILKTFTYTALSTLVTALIIMVIYLIATAFHYDFHATDRLIDARESLRLGLSVSLSLASIAIGAVIYKIFNVKSAGYIMLPFLATLAVVSPANFGLVIGLAVVGYGITRLMRHHSLVLGVSRYSFVLALSVTMVWTAEYLLLRYTSTFSPFMGTSVFAALAVSVLINEHNIYGIRRASPLFAASLALMVAVELGGSYTIQTVRGEPHVNLSTQYVRRHGL